MRRSLADGFVENPGSLDQADGELRDEVEEFGGGGLHDGLGLGFQERRCMAFLTALRMNFERSVSWSRTMAFMASITSTGKKTRTGFFRLGCLRGAAGMRNTLYTGDIMAIKKCGFFWRTGYNRFLQRKAMQKGVILMMDERFIAEIDQAYPQLGFSDRATFIRDAVLKELARQGYRLPVSYKAAPPRVGKSKGGRPKKTVLKPLEEGKVKRRA
jgi:hypothetical protein